MHLYALANDGQVVYAGHADKQKNYSCLECMQSVRVRSGFHRQPHFYHLNENYQCRLNGKSMPHLMLQFYIESVLPKGEVHLEYRFSDIHRIADVAWVKEKIVFEVQCSPISAEEVLQRNADYASQGYQVVWLLHQSRYNQHRISAAEDVLQHSTHYYSNMDGAERGEVYDQPSFILQGMRKQRLPKVRVDLAQPYRGGKADFEKFPRILKKRLKTWKLGFKGDYVNLCREEGGSSEEWTNLTEAISEGESLWGVKDEDRDIFELSVFEFFRELFFRWIALPYRSVLRLFLEKASR